MNAAALDELGRLIARHERFCHLTHVNPDADGFGSALAMSRHLRRLGKDSQVVLCGALPRSLAWLPRSGEVTTSEDPASVPAGAACFLYDFSALRRLGPLESAVAAAGRERVVFDHHDGRLDFECVSFFDADAGATAQILHDVLDRLGAAIDLDLALPLYAGLIADTGSFNYGKTSPHTHQVAARLLEAGVDPLDVHGRMEGCHDLEALLLAARAMTTLTIDDQDPRLAHLTLPLEAWQQRGEDILETVDLVNTTIRLDGVLAGALLVHAAPGTTRLSMRSKGVTSIVEVARSFGGGGHRNAAGATIAGSPDELRPVLLERLRAALATQHGPAPR